MNKKLLEINHLSIEYVTDKETVYAVNDINLEVNERHDQLSARNH